MRAPRKMYVYRSRHPSGFNHAPPLAGFDVNRPITLIVCPDTQALALLVDEVARLYSATHGLDINCIEGATFNARDRARNDLPRFKVTSIHGASLSQVRAHVYDIWTNPRRVESSYVVFGMTPLITWRKALEDIKSTYAEAWDSLGRSKTAEQRVNLICLATGVRKITVTPPEYEEKPVFSSLFWRNLLGES